jgi:hypothetical protein
MIGTDGQDNVPHREWIVAFERVLNEIKLELKNEGREDELFGARVSLFSSQFSYTKLFLDHLHYDPLHHPRRVRVVP